MITASTEHIYVCVRACVRACVHACVRVCMCVTFLLDYTWASPRDLVLNGSVRSEGSGESAHVQTLKSHRCSHKRSMDVDKDCKLPSLVRMAVYKRHLCRFNSVANCRIFSSTHMIYACGIPRFIINLFVWICT